MTTCAHLDQIRDIIPQAIGCVGCLESGDRLGASSSMHELRLRWLLRFVTQQACVGARADDRAPNR